MSEEKFLDDAIRLLMQDFSISKEDAKAMAELTIILEKNNL